MTFQIPHIAGESAQTNVIGMIVGGHLIVLGADPIRQLGQRPLDRGDLFLDGALFGALQIRCGSRLVLLHRCRRSLFRQPKILLDAAGQVAQVSVENPVLLIGDALEQVAIV